MWHWKNDEIIFDCDKKFRPKSTFNPKNKDVIIETSELLRRETSRY